MSFIKQEEQVKRDSIKKEVVKSSSKLALKLIIGSIGLPATILIAIVILVLPIPLIVIGGYAIYNEPINDNIGYYGGNIEIHGKDRFAWPIPGCYRITSEYGLRYHPIDKIKKMHTGVDVAAPSGRKVVAADDGVVYFSGNKGGYGKTVIIKHEGNVETYYAHNSSLRVKKGDKVTKGDVIALSGNSGKSTGSHLHFEVRIAENHVDPLKYFRVERVIPDDVLPEDLKFKKANKNKLKKWLEDRKSYLAKESFIESFIAAGNQYDLDPLLLVAITGQEQSFVPENHRKAKQISKNPFNVFGSWEVYGESFEKSAMIAAATVIKLSKDRPEGEHPLKWINSKSNPRGYYASHSRWWIGVNKFYNSLRKEVGYD